MGPVFIDLPSFWWIPGTVQLLIHFASFWEKDFHSQPLAPPCLSRCGRLGPRVVDVFPLPTIADLGTVVL
jgi:hypothetical protein